MINRQASTHSSLEVTFDDLMASLFVLVTHYSINQSESVLKVIVDRLDTVCHHPEVELYPNQLVVLAKMRRLWRTKLFDIEISELSH